MKKIIYLTAIAITMLMSACSIKTPEGTGIVRKGDYCYRGELSNGKYNGYGVLMLKDSIVYSGQWKDGKRDGLGQTIDSLGRTVTSIWRADTLVRGVRTDSMGVYIGEFSSNLVEEGHGIYFGNDGSFYNGNWKDGLYSGFGCSLSAAGKVRTGEWKAGKFRGERLTYTSERIYGIDISRYQHGKGRKKYPIHWDKVRITHLGKISRKKVSGTVNYPVSFVYIKSTEGISVRNPYYLSDYQQARKHGIHCGAYHFFSHTTQASKQAYYFLKHSRFSKGDFPPVLDVEPTPSQVKAMGGPAAMFSRIRTWLNIVRQHTGVKPILYVSQQFVNKYLPEAPDLMHNYMVWIARYGEYKPDVKLVFWQLCPDGRVSGITGEVDINVFNGYRDQFNQFLINERIK